MEFRLLGPLQLVVGSRPVALGPAKGQVVLAALVLSAPHAVPADTLMDRVWADRVPARGRDVLYTYLSRLRTGLAAGGAPVEIAQGAGGYRALVPPGSVDLHSFRSLVDQARRLPDDRDEQRAGLLRSALGLWRGAALAGLHSPWLDRMRESLEQQRLNALADRIDAELRLRRHHDLVDELIELVGAHPLAERLVGQLMTALARSGQRAAALQCYADARRRIAESLGDEPGADLRDLHTRILRDNGRTAAATVHAVPLSPPVRPTPCQLPGDVRDFVGRETETARLCTAVTSALESATLRPALVSVYGMGGTGKTALAVHAAHRLRDQFPDGQLFANLRGLDERPADPSDVLVEFLRAFGVTGNIVPRELAERAAAFRELVRDRRTLIVLDDATDECQVRPLLPGAGRSAVIVTSRAALGGLDVNARIRLAELNPAEALTLLRSTSSAEQIDADPTAADRLVELCAQLPLALRVAGARLAARPHWTAVELADALSDERSRLDLLHHTDLAVQTSLALSYRAQPPAAADLLRRLGLLPATDFPVWVAAAVLDTGLAAARGLVEELVDAQLLGVSGTDALGQLRYRLHDLVRLFARAEAERVMPVSAREGCRSRYLDGWLAIAEEAERRSPLGYLDPTPAGGGPRWLPELGDGLLADPLAWWATELSAFRASAEEAARSGYAGHAWRLARAALGYFETRGAYTDWRRTHEAALDAARAAGDRRGVATMLHGLGELSAILNELDASHRCLTEAGKLFDASGDRQGSVMCACGLAHLARVAGSGADSLAILRRAADCGGSDRTTAYVHYLTGMAHLDNADWPAAERHFARSLTAARSDGTYLRGEMQALRGLGGTAFLTGDLAAAERYLSEAHDVSRRYGDHLGCAHAASVLAEVARRQGHADRARVLFAESLDVCRRLGEGHGQTVTSHLLDAMYLALGRSEQARAYLDRHHVHAGRVPVGRHA
jgi:DNA-binding SARP family transcriptional activator